MIKKTAYFLHERANLLLPQIRTISTQYNVSHIYGSPVIIIIQIRM